MGLFKGLSCLVLVVFAVGCGGSDNGSEADRLGVGASCAANDDCTEEGQSCLTQFKGGYCGVQGCEDDAGCPAGSACVTHDDGQNYCFLVCGNKDDCNTNREAADEANCSSSITFIDYAKGRKACVPPSGG